MRLSGLRDAFVQMTCTRGVPPAGSRDPRDCVNRLYAFAIPFVWIAKEEQQQVGLNLHVSAIRRIPPESLDPTTKNFHWLDLTMGLLEAYDAGCDIDVLTDDRGNVTEGPGFNIFVVQGRALAHPRQGRVRRHDAAHGPRALPGDEPRRERGAAARERAGRSGRGLHHLDGGRHHPDHARRKRCRSATAIPAP